MTTLKLAEIASVFDALADYIDQTEGSRLREKQAAQQEKAAELAERYAAATGEDLSDALRQKLAGLDPDVLESMLKTTKIAGGSPESLGGPADTSATKTAGHQDANEDADSRFYRWLAD